MCIRDRNSLATDGERQRFRSPHGTQISVHDGLGMVAVNKGPSSGSWIATAAEPTFLPDVRVITGSAGGVLIEACAPSTDGAATSGGCSLSVEVEELSTWSGPSGWEVPASFVDFGDRLVLAPDGQALLRYSPDGFAEVFTNSDQSVSWVTGASMRTGVWGPNSSFVAWIDVLDQPEIRLMFTDARDWVTVDLDQLGLPRPSGPELAVFGELATPATS